MRVSICKGSYWIKGILVLIFVEGYRITYLVVKHIYHADMILFLQKVVWRVIWYNNYVTMRRDLCVNSNLHMDKERMVSKMMNSLIELKECGLPMDDSLRGLRLKSILCSLMKIYLFLTGWNQMVSCFCMSILEGNFIFQ